MRDLPHDNWEKLSFFLVSVCLAVALWDLFIEEGPRPRRLQIASYSILLIMLPLAAYVFWRRR